MTASLTVGIVLVLFIILLAIETPVSLALAASGALGLLLLTSPRVVMSTLGSLPFTVTANYTLSAVTTFVLLGMFAFHGKLAERAYYVASRAFRNFRGGLGVATVAACAGFAAVSGSSSATAATIGKISIGEMIKAGYPARMATGLVASAGTLGILIPPSILMVIYALLAEVSIGRLLLAGVMPGIVSAVVFAIYIAIRMGMSDMRAPADADLGEALDAAAASTRSERSIGRRAAKRVRRAGNSEEAGSGSTAVALADRPPRAEAPDDVTYTRWGNIRGVIWIVVIFAIIMSGVFSGQFTVVESGAIGALVALLVMILERRRAGWRMIMRVIGVALQDTALLVGMIFAILVGAVIFTQFLTVARLPQDFADWLVNLDAAPILIVILILIALIPLGMLLDEMAIVLITVPLVAPAIEALGFDGIWFGILFVKLMEIGLIAPPVGLNAFVIAGTSGVRLETVYRGVLPFIALDIVIVAILMVFPDIVLFLPNLVLGPA